MEDDAMVATKEKPPVNRVAKAISTMSTVKRVRVKIRGVLPGVVFQGKGVMEADADGTKKTGKHRSAQDEAELRAHWTGKGEKRELCIPWVMLYNSICKASESFKFRARKTMSAVVPSTISCEVDNIPLGTSEFEVYEDWVRIPPRTGAMVKIGRPRLKQWEAEFTMIVDAEMYSAESLREIIVHAGKLVGIGAWRAQLKGPYGRFEVVEFEVE